MLRDGFVKATTTRVLGSKVISEIPTPMLMAENKRRTTKQQTATINTVSNNMK